MGLAAVQALVAVGMVAWGLFLMPGTGFWWWWSASFAAAAIAVVSAARLRGGGAAWPFTYAAAGLFVGVNGFVWVISVPFHLSQTGVTPMTATLAGAPVVLGAAQLLLVRAVPSAPAP